MTEMSIEEGTFHDVTTTPVIYTPVTIRYNNAQELLLLPASISAYAQSRSTIAGFALHNVPRGRISTISRIEEDSCHVITRKVPMHDEVHLVSLRHQSQTSFSYHDPLELRS